MRTVYLTPTIATPLSSPDCAPIGAPVTEARALEVDGRVYVLDSRWPDGAVLDDAPEVETCRRIRAAIARELPTRGEREAAGVLTAADREEIAAETAEQAAAATAAWEAELAARNAESRARGAAKRKD